MQFNSIDPRFRYAYMCMSEIESLLDDTGFGEDVTEVLEAVEKAIADAIWQKTRDWDKSKVYFDDVFLCIDGCGFKAEGQEDGEAAPAEMLYPDMSNVDKALRDIGLELDVDWDNDVEYSEDLDEYGRYSAFIGDVKAVVKLVDVSKFMKFVRSLKGIVSEDVEMTSDGAGCVKVNLKTLVYEMMNPLAQDANCQLLLLDRSCTHDNYLSEKMQAFGVSVDECDQLLDAVEQHGCAAVLKCIGECDELRVLRCFAPAGLKQECLHRINAEGRCLMWFAVQLNGFADV